MVLLCKQKALYVKCCIIANGVEDTQGDTLYREDIKKIFTSFNNQDNFEIYHDEIPLQEVSLLENYISIADETIGTRIAPKGSWMAVARVDNPDIQEGMLTGEFQGVSLNNRIADKCKANLHGKVRYEDLADAECVIPLYISFVKRGANGYGLHVMDYDAYIKKSDSVETERSKKNMAFDLLGGLKKLIQQAEADTEPVIVKEDPEEEKPVDKPTEEEEDPNIKKEDTEESESEEDEKEKEDEKPSIEKEDNDDADFEAKVTLIVKKVLEELKAEEKPADDGESKEEPVDEDTPKITKSAKVTDIEDGSSTGNQNYYELTGRDPLTGRPKE